MACDGRQLERTTQAELLYPEDWGELSPYFRIFQKGLRRRPLWEFELETARQQLTSTVRHPQSARFRCGKCPGWPYSAAGCLLQYVEDCPSAPHCRISAV
ncbi:hypothetical protein ACNKHW_17205 [Shigella flexneri]